MKAILYKIDGPWPGQLSIIPRPRGGDWLEDETHAWRAEGIDIILSALTCEENEELDLDNEGKLCQAEGMEYINYPIADRGLPSSIQETSRLIRELEEKLAEGKNVAVHCRQGVGRSALLAACLLAGPRMDVEKAFESIAKARGCSVPDTEEQKKWVHRFVHENWMKSKTEDEVA